MKATRLLLLNLAAAGFLCLPVFSAYGATPQHDENSTVNHQHGENHGTTTNRERGARAQEHRSTQAAPNSKGARPQANSNRARPEQNNNRARPEQNSNRARPEQNNNRAHSEHNGNRTQQQRGNRNNSQSARNRGNQRTPTYQFRPQDQQRLRQNYSHFNYRHEVNSRNRAHLYRGGYLPNGWRGRMHRLPPQYLREFPPPPVGYLIGYFDGFAVVYNPNTGLILQFVNVY